MGLEGEGDTVNKRLHENSSVGPSSTSEVPSYEQREQILSQRVPAGCAVPSVARLVGTLEADQPGLCGQGSQGCTQHTLTCSEENHSELPWEGAGPGEAMQCA